MESHLATKTLSFFSILEQTWHFIKLTSPTSLKMGFALGNFKAQTSWNLTFTLVSKTFFHFLGLKNMHIFNNNGVKVFKRFKHFRNFVTILRRNSYQFKVFNWLLYSLMWLDLDSPKETNSLHAKAFLRTQPPKKYFNLKLFGTCNFGGMVKT